MTPNELQKLTPAERWNLFSCASRCLIFLANAQNKSISKENFMAKFGHLFPSLYEGLTNTAEQIEIAKDLGLCTSAVALRDLRKLKDMRVNGIERGILVLTDRDSDDNGAELFHCRVLCGFDDTKLELFSPLPDGSEPILSDTWANLEKQLVHFLVFV